MKIISIRELHEKTGYWVRRSVTLGPIPGMDYGKVVAQIVSVQTMPADTPFFARKLRIGYARLRGKFTGGTDSTLSISEDRDRA